jgi:hypothetical protein
MDNNTTSTSASAEAGHRMHDAGEGIERKFKAID